jgi:hypothetical protein
MDRGASLRFGPAYRAFAEPGGFLRALDAPLDGFDPPTRPPDDS